MTDEIYTYTYLDDEEAAADLSFLELDAGMAFYDGQQTKHTQACGWLAVHAALHYYYDQGLLPPALAARFLQHDFLPGRLKLMSNVYGGGPHGVIYGPKCRLRTGPSLQQLARYIGLDIDLYEVRSQYEPTRYAGKKGAAGSAPTIQLVLYCGHYTAVVGQKGRDEATAERFVAQFPAFGYSVGRPGSPCHPDTQQLLLQFSAEDAAAWVQQAGASS